MSSKILTTAKLPSGLTLTTELHVKEEVKTLRIYIGFFGFQEIYIPVTDLTALQEQLSLTKEQI